MEWTQEQYDQIKHLVPIQRGNVDVNNLTFLRRAIAKNQWKYDEELYKEQNMVEQNFRLIKEFRRVHILYDKLDETYNAFIVIANITDYMKN